jgi:uncharacterized protein (DUF952 family)
MRLFHIVAADVWASAVEVGEYRPESLDVEGFVHCSFIDQVAGTATRYYAGVSGLLVVEFDPSALPEVRVEDSYGSGTAFPHVYGSVPSGAALHSWPLEEFIASTEVIASIEDIAVTDVIAVTDRGDDASRDR